MERFQPYEVARDIQSSEEECQKEFEGICLEISRLGKSPEGALRHACSVLCMWIRLHQFELQTSTALLSPARWLVGKCSCQR